MKSGIFEKLMDYYMVITCSIFFYIYNAWNFHGEATNFRGEATNFRGAMSNFRGAMSNFRGEATNFRGEATNFCGEATGGNQWPLQAHRGPPCEPVCRTLILYNSHNPPTFIKCQNNSISPYIDLGR